MLEARSFAWLAAGSFALLTIACGGDDSAGPSDDPPAVAEVLVSPATATIDVGAQQPFTAEVRDASGNVLTDRSVSWSVSESAVATISTSGVAAAVGPGVTTVTATSEGVEGTAVLTAEIAAFAPTSNTSLSGSRVFSEVHVPAGVTVEVTGDLVITVAGPVAIEGELHGDCHRILVLGSDALILSGTIDNECASPPAGGGGDLLLLGAGEIDIDGATMTSSGNVGVANLPQEVIFDRLPISLGSVEFVRAAATVSASAGARAPTGPLLSTAGPFPCTIRNYTVVTGAVPAAAGVNGVNGGAGANGSGFGFGCNGDLAFQGNVQIETQDGGPGGNGLGAPHTTGGSGGDGGLLVVLAFGDMSFTHETPGEIPNHFFSGSGGPGGSSISDVPDSDPAPDVAPGGSAVGGDGGAAGATSFEAQNVMTIAPESFYAGPGSGGDGGEAEAVGADGVDAADRAGNAQVGGPASATGGRGGDAPGFHHLALEDIVGQENLVFDDTADAGDGGTAAAWGGKGGDGEDGEAEDKAGAKGGDVEAIGGTGGDAGSGRGGNGGAAVFLDAWGGDGWVDCRLPLDLSGGMGGAGGDASGGDGAGGSGLNPGVPGGVLTFDVSNGGDGGDGEPVGGAGAAGVDGITVLGGRGELGVGSFQDGNPGNPCKSGTYTVEIIVESDPAGHNPFIGLGEVTELVIELGTDGTITISGPAPWVSVTGTRDVESGEIEAEGEGEVAGFDGVSVRLTGTLTCDNELDVVLEMGVEGELFGVPIEYRVTGAQSGPSPAPFLVGEGGGGCSGG